MIDTIAGPFRTRTARRSAPAGSLLHLILLTLVVLLATGCAKTRPALAQDELERRRAISLRETENDIVASRGKAVARMYREWCDFRAGLTTEPPVFDVLILSGGGDYGAFGAGFLRGWAQRTRTQVTPGTEVDHSLPDLRLPEFDVVTGVSTGALIAPFAFIGDDASLQRVLDLYSEPKKDWVELRDLFFFLPGRESFLDTTGLWRDIRAQIDKDVIEQIAAGSRRGRVLAIGTTDLDLGVLKPWRLGLEAEVAAETGDPTRVHQILLASAAIPGAFPPVIIDDTLYVDGGTTSNIIFGIDARAPSPLVPLAAELYPDMPMPRIRYWVIINNQIGAAPRIVQPTWTSIVGASVSTAIRSSTIGSLRQLALLARFGQDVEDLNVEFRFVAIPDDWRSPNPTAGIFDRETMQSLARLGEELGSMPASAQRPNGAWTLDVDGTQYREPLEAK